MGLRDLKRSGGYLTQSPPIGEWVRYRPGELVKCPMPDCSAGLTQPDAYSVAMVRVAMVGLGEPGQPSGFTLCPDSRCKARIQIRYEQAEGSTNPASDRLTLRL